MANQEHDMVAITTKDKSNDQQAGIRKITTQDAPSIASIATKVGITPNQLVEMYQIPDGSGTYDLHSMAKEFDGGKGIQALRDKHREFDEEQDEAQKPQFLKDILNDGRQSHEHGGRQ